MTSEIKRPTTAACLAMLLVLLLWLAGSWMDLEKYADRYTLILLLGGLCIVSLLLLSILNKPRWFTPPTWTVVFPWIAIALCFMVIHPISTSHTITIGNDSEDALYRGATNLLSRHFPYYSKTYLGNPITPMPGALFIDLPFAAMGHAGLQNIFWLAAFTYFAIVYFRKASTALVYLVLVIANAHTFVNIMTGADYPVNCFYVCIASYWFLQTTKETFGWQRLGSTVLLGLSLSSRLTYLLIVPIVLSAYMVQLLGWKRGFTRVAQPLLITAVITAPFYLYDPSRFSPLHVANFLSAMTPKYQHLVFRCLTGGAIAVALSGFLVKLTEARYFLIVGLAACIILLPPGIVVAIHQHFTVSGVLVLGYTDTSYIMLSLWLCRSFEQERFQMRPSLYKKFNREEGGANL